MKVIDFGTVEVDGRFLKIPKCVKEMIVDDIKASNCFPAAMQHILEEQGVINGGCKLTIRDFVLSGVCVIGEAEVIMEVEEPDAVFKEIKWWLLSDEKARKIRLLLLDCMNTTGSFVSSRSREAMDVLDSARAYSNEMPDNFFSLSEEYKLLRARTINITALHTSGKISTGILRNGFEHAFRQFEENLGLSKE